MSDFLNQLKRSWPLLGGLFLFLGGLLFFYANRVETRKFRLEKLKVKVETGTAVVTASSPIALSASDSRLRILHISDLHLCDDDHKKVEFIRAITDDAYDMVVLTGDIFQFSQGMRYAGSLLARKPRLGAYAVFGNHDYYDYSLFNKTIGRIFRKHRQPELRKDVSPHRRALENGGFHVLVNQCLTVKDRKGAEIFIAGVDYPGISSVDLATLMTQAPPAALKLALFHLPWRLEQLAAAGFHMAFGGHTHGGQIRVPGFGAIITDSELDRSEASGLLRRGKTFFHISRGLGADPRSNIRLFCPPAATVIELDYNLSAIEAADAVVLGLTR